VWYKSIVVFTATSLSSGYFFADTLQITYYGIPPLVPILIHHLLAGVGVRFTVVVFILILFVVTSWFY
jgi:hypothetical protein